MSAGPSSHPGESAADRIIRQAMEDGEFDDLDGKGKPIPGRGMVDDELWWLRDWVKRNTQTDIDEAAQQEKPPAPA